MTVGVPASVPLETSRPSSESSLNSIGALAPSGRTDLPMARSSTSWWAQAVKRSATPIPSAPLLVPLRPLEPLLSVGEEHVERGERSVAAGDVLLHRHLVLVRELRVRIDSL